MNIKEKAKRCYDALRSINEHILGEEPTVVERKAAYEAIENIWDEFSTKSVIEEYKINKSDGKLRSKLEILERVLNINPIYYRINEKI